MSRHGLDQEKVYEERRAHLRELCGSAVERLRSALGLEDWRVDLQYQPLEGKGEVDVDPRYRKATIRIDVEKAEGDDDVLDTLRHELLHCYHARYVTAWRMLTKHVEGAAQESITVAIMDADEEVVRRIEDLLDRCLRISAREMAERPPMNPAIVEDNDELLGAFERLVPEEVRSGWKEVNVHGMEAWIRARLENTLCPGCGAELWRKTHNAPKPI